MVVISNCPPYINNSLLVRACLQCNSSDTFQILPVLDKETNISYKNYFCAQCNRAKEIIFWQAQHGCDEVPKINEKTINWTSFMRHCNKYPWEFLPPNNTVLEYCAPHKYGGWLQKANSNKQVDWDAVKDICEAYYLPVHQVWQSILPTKTLHNNPHCLLSAIQSTSPFINSHCPSVKELNEPIAGIQVLFDFSSTSQFKVNVGSQKTLIVETKRCNKHQVYDPFSQLCRDLAPIPKPLKERKTHINNSHANLTNSTSNVTVLSRCVRVPFTNKEIKLFSNGSVYIKLHNHVYPKNSYIANGSGIILCTNLSRNYTKTKEKSADNKESIHSLALRLITYVGGALSILNLIILIAVYIRIKEIKKLPGKIVMSLAWTLLAFQVGFFLNGVTGRPVLCSAVAVLLHYFLLASFTWMNVLAIDMAFTFVSLGKSHNQHFTGIG